MVPFDAFSTEAPHSSIAFCSGCDGGTQCESLSSTGLSWVSPAQGQASASAAERNMRNTAFRRVQMVRGRRPRLTGAGAARKYRPELRNRVQEPRYESPQLAQIAARPASQQSAGAAQGPRLRDQQDP